MIQYSPKSAKALAYLKKAYNDVDIFVEDAANPNMWLILLRPLLPQGTKLTSVNVLGGRSKVISACRLDQADLKRRRLYIIDGDFDFLLAKPKPKLKHLYRVRAYCIENILIHEHALVQIGIALKPSQTELQVANILSLQAWKNELATTLTPLFVMYAVSQKLSPSQQTVGFDVMRLCTNGRQGPTLSKRKVMGRTLQVARQVRQQAGLLALAAELQQMRIRVRKLPMEQVISGKNYALPLLLTRFAKMFGSKYSREQFKVRLAEFWEDGQEPWLARRVRHL